MVSFVWHLYGRAQKNSVEYTVVGKEGLVASDLQEETVGSPKTKFKNNGEIKSPLSSRL